MLKQRSNMKLSDKSSNFGDQLLQLSKRIKKQIEKDAEKKNRLVNNAVDKLMA